MRRVIYFGKYELLSRINIGGMAEIVKARDTGSLDDRIVAIKRILPHLCADQHYRAMFLDESRVLTQLDHPSIIKVYEIGEIDGTPYIALEYIQGQDARELFHACERRGEPTPIELVCTLIARVCEGLQHAHEQKDEQGQSLGVVHRDVSLQNVLISYDGDVKLTDFGIAVSAENESRTEAGVVKGKFGYMSPEQIRGTSLDRRSDVFSVGICLYELLTGERLFSGENDYKALERVQKVDIRPPSTINRQIPSGLERVVLKALAKHPRDRYQSTNDLRRALQAFMAEAKLFATREDLGAYMQRVFAQEYAQSEQERLAYQEHIDKGAGHVTVVNTVSAASLFDASDRTTVAGGDASGEAHDAWSRVAEESTGLAAFDALPPVQPFVERSEAADAEGNPDTQVTVPGAPDRFDMEWDEYEPTTISRGVEASQDAVPASAPGPALPISPPPTRELAPLPRTVSEHSMRSLPTLELRRPRETRFAAIAIAVTLAAVVSGLVVFWLKDRGVGGLRIETEPVDCIVRVDGRRLAGERSPFTATQLSTRLKHTVVVERSGYASWSTTLRLVPDQVFALPPVRLAPVNPPSDAPPPTDATAAAPTEPAPSPAASGKAARRAAASMTSRAPRTSAERTPQPRPSERAPKEEEPARSAKAPASKAQSGGGAMATLRINTRPWSRVVIDGVPHGNTPQMNLQLRAGSHTVILTNPEFGVKKELTITLKPGETVTRVLTLAP